MSQPSLPCPTALLGVAEALERGGFRSWWVGESLARALEGRPSRHLLLRSNASPAELFATLPDAVAVGRPDELELAARLTGAVGGLGPLCVDVLAAPRERTGAPEEIAEAVAAAPFTRQALGVELGPAGPLPDGWIDPHDGRSDVAARTLQTTGDAGLLFAARPDLALRALRYLGEEGLEPSAALNEALTACKPELRGKHVARMREQLRCLFRHPRPAASLAWMARVGLAQTLAPGCLDDVPAVVERVEVQLERRLVAWMRGVSGSRALRRLRFGSPLGARVLVLLDHHPIEASGRGGAIPTAQRHRRRLAPSDLDFLLRLREIEIDVLAQTNPSAAQAASASLAHMRDALAIAAREDAIRQARLALVLHGEDVMAEFACGPGRRVGQALHHLATCVADGTRANTREALGDALKLWAADHPASEPETADADPADADAEPETSKAQ